MDNFYTKTVEESLQALQTSRQGIATDEIESRREQYGKNELEEGKKKSILVIFLEQFKDLLVIILIIAAIISAITGGYASTLVILAVIILNAILGTVQYVKAEKSLKALKAMSAPTAKVMRDGVLHIIPSNEVVVGDIIVLEAGDLVIADGRIIDNYSLQINESSLTGESTAVDKSNESIAKDDIALGDRINMVFSGSLVTYGRAGMLVTATGMQTEIGKIATLMNATKDKKTPLQKNLDQFSKVLALIIMGICLIVMALTIWRGWNPDDIQGTIINSLMFAVALAVAAIPEALSSIVTIVQAVGTQKMAKQHAIIKDLKAVESLGAVSIICSDKTGTLTQNKMTVSRLYVDNEFVTPKELREDTSVQKMLLDACCLVNDSQCGDGGQQIGDPTEIALTMLCIDKGYNELSFRQRFPRVSELAFDSDRKLMSVLIDYNNSRTIMTKGAIDSLLPKCHQIITSDGVKPMTDADVESIKNANLEMSMNGLRVLSFAVRADFDGNTLAFSDESSYAFVGLVAMIDPPREESRQAVADAILAGIKPIMITGDHKITAQAIARDIGIMKDGDSALEGVELEAMTDEELDARLESISVYARVSPEHKIRIVDAWQRRGHIVAMTGDGVNDAPALKKAEIGVAMGITGTEVSKDAADMILTDDNFATIVNSVTNGRSVYVNIRNAVIFLLSGNIAGIFCILLTSIMGWDRPFDTVQLLFINLITDSLPAIAIGMEAARHDLLYDKPRDPKAPLLSGNVLMQIALQGAIISVFTMIAYSISWGNPAVQMTMAFATISLARLIHAFNCRGKKNIFSLKFRSNKFSIYALLAGSALLAFVVFTPGVKTLFSAASLSGFQVLMILVCAIAPTVIIQTFKIIKDYLDNKKRKQQNATIINDKSSIEG